MSGHQPASGSVLDHQAGTRRTFVVQLRLDADPVRGRVAGRVQHTHSNDASHFDSVDELLAFIAAHVRVISEG
jgi:hypothetical protein